MKRSSRSAFRPRHTALHLALLATFGSAPALAATINVGVGGCTLVDAITAANADAVTGGCTAGSGADIIVLPSGSTQSLTSVNNSTYGASGLPVVISAITIQGNGSTITRAAGSPVFRIFTVDGTSSALTLQDTTVTAGATGAKNFGGGVRNRYGTLTLNNSTISGNSAGLGGGIASYGTGVKPPTLVLNNSTVSGNSAVAGGGGGVYSFYGSDTLTNSIVSGNSASGNGGGVYTGFGNIALTDSTVSGNTASGYGGGVYDKGRSISVTLTRSTVSGNSALDGGGLAQRYGALNVIDSTISRNSASNHGGGVHNSYGDVTLIDSTVSGNTASDGGGLFGFAGIVTLTHSLLSGNTAATGAEVDISGDRTTVNLSGNLFGHSGLTNAQAFVGFTPSGSDITATSNGTTPKALSAILNTTLANNGGPTQTHALVTSSPAIDAAGATCSATDQRGITRPQGAACDIGAFESGAVIPTPIPSHCDTHAAGINLIDQRNAKTPQTIFGLKNQKNVILGSRLGNVIHAGDMGDCIEASSGGNNKIYGGKGDDILIGGPGNDVIYGGGGNDLIIGNGGNDTLDGESGNDTLISGKGSAKMQGGPGTDRCEPGSPQDILNSCEMVGPPN